MAKDNWRDDFSERLLEVLRVSGPSAFMEQATAYLNLPAGEYGKVKAQIVGELCETVLVGLTTKYLEITGHKGKVFHSMVLADLNAQESKFRTELDFTLATPCFVLTTECKSYAGEIAISGDCTLSNGRYSVDVYRQSMLHHKILVEYARQLIAPRRQVSVLPVFANAFVFSNGNIHDKRSPDQAKKLTVLTSSSLFSYYDAVFKRYTVPVFNYDSMIKAFTMCTKSKRLHHEHKDYLGY